jgi:hypothetical protein
MFTHTKPPPNNTPTAKSTVSHPPIVPIFTNPALSFRQYTHTAQPCQIPLKENHDPTLYADHHIINTLAHVFKISNILLLFCVNRNYGFTLAMKSLAV